MRRLWFWVVVVCLLVALSTAAWANSHVYNLPGAAEAQTTVLEQSDNRLLVRIDVPEMQTGQVEANGAAWDVIAVEGLGTTSQVGAPELPVWTRLVAVGPAEGVQARVASAREETLVNIDAMPFQTPQDRCCDTPPPFVIDEELYTTDGFWPAQPVVTDEPVIMHGRRFVPVHFYPLQYNPVTGELRYAESTVLEITGGTRDPRNVLTRELPASQAFAAVYESFGLSFARRGAQDNWAPVDGAIMVIAPDNFLDGINKYVEWKTKKGLPVEVVPTSAINGQGQDAPAIKKMIHNRYFNAQLPPLDYVVIFGDFAQVTTMFGLGGCSSDSKFVTVDGQDYFPDVVIGRLSAQTLEELGRVVNKMVDYEASPQMDETDWYQSGIVLGSGAGVDDQNALFCGQVLEQQGGYTHVDYLYEKDNTATAANITKDLNAGRSWFTYFGHGAWNLWASCTPYYTNANVKQLKNNRQLPVITSIACENGAFDYDQECFAEVWISWSERAGAAGIFAASRNTPFGYTDSLGRGVAVGHFKEKYLTFGAACYYGKMWMYGDYPEPAGGTTEEVFQHYLIFGDPELNIWSDVPADLSVQPDHDLQQGDGSVVITVLKDGAPFANALVHAWGNGDTDVAARTTEAGQVEISFAQPLAAGELQVVVTGQNAYPWESGLTVAAPADDDAVDDDAADDDQSSDDDATDDDASDDDDDSGGGCA
jgi:gingipain R